MRRSGEVRDQLALPMAASERFERLEAAAGASKSGRLAGMTEARLDPRAPAGLEQRSAVRLGGLPMELIRIDCDGHGKIKRLALFIRDMLSLNGPLAEQGFAGWGIGRNRFAAFVQRVDQQRANRRLTLLGKERS